MTVWDSKWDCQDCPYTAIDYVAAEFHRRSTGHSLEVLEE